jgi:hypothetical protein
MAKKKKKETETGKAGLNGFQRFLILCSIFAIGYFAGYHNDEIVKFYHDTKPQQDQFAKDTFAVSKDVAGKTVEVGQVVAGKMAEGSKQLYSNVESQIQSHKSTTSAATTTKATTKPKTNFTTKSKTSSP